MNSISFSNKNILPNKNSKHSMNTSNDYSINNINTLKNLLNQNIKFYNIKNQNHRFGLNFLENYLKSKKKQKIQNSNNKNIKINRINISSSQNIKNKKKNILNNKRFSENIIIFKFEFNIFKSSKFKKKCNDKGI